VNGKCVHSNKRIDARFGPAIYQDIKALFPNRFIDAGTFFTALTIHDITHDEFLLANELLRNEGKNVLYFDKFR